jgi:hypothetical protein
LAVETKSFSSPPPSSKASKVLASPVDCRPITTHWRTENTLIRNKNILAFLSTLTSIFKPFQPMTFIIVKETPALLILYI